MKKGFIGLLVTVFLVCSISAAKAAAAEGASLVLFISALTCSTSTTAGGIYVTIKGLDKVLAQKQERLEKFVTDNDVYVAQDIAMGNGETLNTIADILEIDNSLRNDFNKDLQTKYSDIFKNENFSGKNTAASIMKIAYKL